MAIFSLFLGSSYRYLVMGKRQTSLLLAGCGLMICCFSVDARDSSVGVMIMFMVRHGMLAVTGPTPSSNRPGSNG